MISFLNLKYFLALAEEMNFNLTAKKMHITQQSLSGHIKKIENHFNVQLFNYGPPLRITVAGLMLKKHAQILLDAEYTMSADMSELNTLTPGVLTIGCTFARAQFLLPPIIHSFQEKHPYIKLNILEGNTPAIESALKSGEVDVSVGYTPANIKNIISIPLYLDPYRLVVHPQVLEQSFPDRKPIYFYCYEEHVVKEVLEKCPFLTMTTNTTIGSFGKNYLRQLNITPTSTLELKDVGTMLSMCYSGMGTMLCPQTFISKSFYKFSGHHLIYPLPNQKSLEISINYSAKKANSTIIQAFAKIVKEELREDFIS